MIRLANVTDAEQLYELNLLFNGENTAPPRMIRASLEGNRQELVVVAEENGVLAGFVCAQVKASFCYQEVSVEITEVYVRENFRRAGIAQGMIAFVQDWCMEHYPVEKFTLLTGQRNIPAQQLYRKLGYRPSGELHLEK